MIKFPDKNLISGFHKCPPHQLPAETPRPSAWLRMQKTGDWRRQIMEWSVAPLRGATDTIRSCQVEAQLGTMQLPTVEWVTA